MLTINNTLDGYLKDVEILGNTIQDSENLADIRSVGDKVEGQELYEIPVLSVGKNLFNTTLTMNTTLNSSGIAYSYSGRSTSDFIKIFGLKSITISNNSSASISRICLYDKDMNYLSDYTNSSVITNNPYYLRFAINSIDTNLKVQLEEGTQATPYEPYQEDKLTILSPVQLEKVGDVRDRIICKDGVWGVEKNVKTVRLGSESAWSMRTNNSGITLFATSNYLGNGISNRVILCDALTVNNGANQDGINGYNQILAHKNANYSQNIYISKDFEDVTLFTAWLNKNPVNIKYGTETEAQFIPLPHDQQIKLRTFANKTNISFLTEIEGTIKAQVPKSIGATVNTHTEQINNLNKELDRVKKLEESTVSTVTTESDFTTVEATSNGYFEDVKLEGKTLVNLVNDVKGASKQTLVADGTNKNIIYKTCRALEVGKEYTFIAYISRNTLQGNGSLYLANSYTTKPNISIPVQSTGIIAEKIVISDTHTDRGYHQLAITSGVTSGEIDIDYYMILEGDHTQNPPSYFEGLKSVSDGVDEIVVSSNNNQPKQIKTTYDNSITTTIDNPNYQSDKKRLLYYNEETQAWEKPILRQWDSIEKHADGKYYYHQRSGEVVLNGSDDEGWSVNNSLSSDNGKTFNSNKIIDTLVTGTTIADKFPSTSYADLAKKDYEFITNNTVNWFIKITPNKLITQDIQGFKQWLQTNNVTVVYQLAQEKVYECTNIDLITYNGETNYIVESGVLSPKTTLKVHNNISNVVSLLQKKVSLLESNITKYMITQNRLQLSSTYSADSVTFKVDYAVYSENRSQENYNTDLYNLILNNILVGKDNYDYDHMFNIIMDYASWSQISWDQFDILVGIMDLQHNPPIEPPIEEVPCETPEE